MCKIYNTVGSLKVIKSHLRAHNVSDFKSIRELTDFKKNYYTAQQQIFSNHSILIEQEKEVLKVEIPELETFIDAKKAEAQQNKQFLLHLLNQRLSSLPSKHTNSFGAFSNGLKKIAIKSKMRINQFVFKYKSKLLAMRSANTLAVKVNRFNYIDLYFTDAVNESSKYEHRELEHKKKVIDEITPSIYGAIGEQKVVRELENLSEDYILINDFSHFFNPPIYNKGKRNTIKSIQIDHLLISPAGIFLIETKNWSEVSINNENLYSPVSQILRSNFALFKILEKEINNVFNFHHWGRRKVPIKNIIVLINSKPREEFEYVKILTLKEIRNYVGYFKPVFSKKEVEGIARYLLKHNKSNG